jgi:hypothetical protein
VPGIVLGFIFGSRATRDAYRLDQKAAEERARRQAERATRKAQEGGDKPAPRADPLALRRAVDRPALAGMDAGLARAGRRRGRRQR